MVGRFLHFIFAGLVALLFSACSGSITEVGNPTAEPAAEPTTIETSAAVTDSLAQVVVSATEGLVGGSLLVKAVQQLEEESFADCEYDEDLDQEVCACPGGGTMTRTFAEGEEISESLFSFEDEFTITLADCVVIACEQTLVLNGTSSGDMSGTYNPETDEGSMTFHQTTSSACSGMTINDVSMGFDITVTYDGTDEDYSGTFCLDGEEISFASQAELRSEVDPDNTCEDGFGGETLDDEEEIDDEEEESGSFSCESCTDDCLFFGTFDDEFSCLAYCIDAGCE